MGPPAEPPDETLLDMLETALRGYPEIEWACIGTTAQGVAVGIRMDARMRKNVDEIASLVASVAAPRPLPILLLDDPAQMRASRTDALVFYPWRRR
jgi:hypothetical protein